jgi:hypothetical protein
LRAKMRHAAMEYLHVIEIVLHLRLEGPRIEAGVQDHDIIRVDDQGIVDVLDLAQSLQCKGSVIAEIPPRLVDHRAWDIMLGKEIADDLLRPVLGAGIDDEDVIDKRKRARQALTDELRLVLDDHTKPDGFDPRIGSPWSRGLPLIRCGPGRPTSTAAAWASVHGCVGDFSLCDPAG